jgi:hypothetical protein
MTTMNFLERLINILLVIGLGLLIGYGLGRYQEAQQVAGCPAETGRVAVQQTVRKDGSYTCIYVRAMPGMAEYVKEIRK